MKRLVIASALLLAACGGPSTSPTGVSAPAGGGLPYQADRYRLQILGGSLACGDNKNPQAGTFVNLLVNMKPDATGWTATTEDGGFSLRLEPGSPATAFGPARLTGTARGAADDQVTLPLPTSPPPSGTRMTIVDAIPVAAVLTALLVPGFADFTTGTFNGAVVFSRNGVTATCPAGAVGFTLSRNIL